MEQLSVFHWKKNFGVSYANHVWDVKYEVIDHRL